MSCNTPYTYITVKWITLFRNKPKRFPCECNNRNVHLKLNLKLFDVPFIHYKLWRWFGCHKNVIKTSSKKLFLYFWWLNSFGLNSIQWNVNPDTNLCSIVIFLSSSTSSLFNCKILFFLLLLDKFWIISRFFFEGVYYRQNSRFHIEIDRPIKKTGETVILLPSFWFYLFDVCIYLLQRCHFNLMLRKVFGYLNCKLLPNSNSKSFNRWVGFVSAEQQIPLCSSLFDLYFDNVRNVR